MPSPESPRPILVPVDLSATSEAALTWATIAARCFAAPVLILHVVHDPESAPGYYSRPLPDGYLRSLEESGSEMFGTFLEEIRSRHPELADDSRVRSRLVVGLPATRILEVAEEEDAQLIVMGSVGRTGLSKFLLGSKALRVAQLSPIPVTIVKLSDPENLEGTR